MSATDPQYANGVEHSPTLDKHLQTSVKGLHIVGAANGSPLLKTCINEGVQVIRSICRLMPPAPQADDTTDDGNLVDLNLVDLNLVDLVIVGAGPAGLSAALEAEQRGYTFTVLEQGRPLNTIANFPTGKHVYAEPATLRTLGALDLDDATKEELLTLWQPLADQVPITRGVNVAGVTGHLGDFTVADADGRSWRGRRVIIASGRMGNPRQLGVPGEDLPCVYTALLNPGKYRDQKIVVIGGGNSAAEAAVSLAPRNQVTIVHRDTGFPRVSRANRDALDTARQQHGLQVLLKAKPTAFAPGGVTVAVDGQDTELPRDVAFVLIGTDPPTAFLKRMGVTFDGQWGWRLLPKLLWVFALVYTLYGTKFGIWPFGDLYHHLHEIGLRPDLLYGVLYSVLLTGFGARALGKYGDDPYQQKRYTTLIASQWLIYFILPWALFYAGYSEWWRTWTVTLPFPLGYYGLWQPADELFSGTSLPWAVAAVVAFLVVMPIASIYHGKRFCSWVCPCGGLADTVGDQWRHKAPRGKGVRRWEHLQTVILVVTVLISIMLISGYRGFLDPGQVKNTYKTIVDITLASIVAITLYPFAGSRFWCRFACPLAKWMELWSRWTGGKLAIVPNDECISCGECTKYCQMGIDVRAFAQREQPLSNLTTSCVFCGICVTVCPVDVLEVKRQTTPRT